MGVLQKPQLVKLYREFRQDQRKTASECYWSARSYLHSREVWHKQGLGVTNRRKRRLKQ